MLHRSTRSIFKQSEAEGVSHSLADMSRREQKSRVSTAGPDDSFITNEHNTSRPSMLYNVLPSLVSSRIPALPSLRKSLNTKRQGKLNPLTEIPPRPRTPPPNYTSRPGSGTVTPNVFSGDADFDFSDDGSERIGSSSSANPPPFAIYETRTGINWKYARSGTDFGAAQ